MNPALAALAGSIALAGGLWPFGGGVKGAPTSPTIAELERPQLELKTELTVPVDQPGLVREQYRLFLEISAAYPELRREATRRLADLTMDAGEEQLVAGASDAAFFQEAIALYSALLEQHPDYADADLVWYQLARAYESTGATGQAMATLDGMVSRYPDSRYYDEAQFRRGEALFVAGRYREAAAAYGALIAAGDESAYYEQALYKHGWALFKLGDHDPSFDSFIALLDRRLPADGHAFENLTGAQRELLDDTLRVLGISFSYLDGSKTIDELLERFGERPYAGLLYTGLGDLYIDKERYSDAAEAYAAFVSRYPVDEFSPYLQQRVIEAYSRGRFATRVLEAKEHYVELYGFDGPFWNDRSPPDYPNIEAQLKTNLADLASYDHAIAQANDDRKAYVRAARWYRRYLEFFPGDPDSARRSFLLADILFEIERYAEATAQYLDAAYAYGAHAHDAEAGYASLLAAKKHEATLDGAAREAWYAEYIEFSLKFATAFPAHEQAAPVRTHIAEELFRDGQLERAEQVAGLVVTMQPPVPVELERTAWTVIAHARFDLGRFADAEQAYARLRGLSPSVDQRAEIDRRIAAAVYRQGEQRQAAGDIDGAVSQYLRVGNAVPDSDVVPTAIFDAATLLINAKRWGDSIDVLESFRARFPDHEFNDDVVQKLAVALEKDGKPGRAAAEYERIARLASVGDDANREALWQSAELYEVSARPADAIRVYTEIVRRFAHPVADAMEARAKLAELSRETGDPQGRRRWLAAIIDADANAGDARTPRTRTLAANATLELAGPARDAFAAVRLNIPLKQSLKTKKQLMESALDAYGKAAAYEIADVTTAATFEIGQLYFTLSRDLMNSERPAELNADELEQYEILLEEQAFPFEERAIEIFEANAARAADGVFDQWVQKSYERLAELMPGRYAKSERSETVVAELQ